MAKKRQSPYRLYLVLDPLTEVLPRLETALKPLEEIGPHLPGVEGFYDDKTDAALLGLQFKRSAAERIGPSLLIELVAECGLPVIAPEELGEDEFVSFFGAHLPAYPVQIRHQSGATRSKPIIQHMIDSLRMKAKKSGNTSPEIALAVGTGTDHDSIEINLDAPPLPPKKPRASSRWELVLDDDEEVADKQPSSEWEWDLVL